MEPTKEQKIAALVPYFMNLNEGKSAGEIRVYLHQMSDADLQYTYDRAVPLEPDLEAKIAKSAEKAAERTLLLMNIEQNNQVKREQHEKNARAKFADIARTLGISNHEANFQIAYALHPSVFNVEDIGQFISDGRLQFIPPTAEEQQQTELIEKNQIVETVLDSLRGQFVRKIVGYGPQNFDVFLTPTFGESKQQNRERQLKVLMELPLVRLQELHQQAEANKAVRSGQPVERPSAPPDPNLNSGSGLDRANGGTYLPLPQTNQYGETLDAAYLVKLANKDFDLYKRLVRKHGYKHMTDRIRGIA